MFDSFFVDHLLYQHMAEVRQREARRRLLGPGVPPRQRRRQGLIRRFVQIVSILGPSRHIERGTSQ
jgi:hypothetical protein